MGGTAGSQPEDAKPGTATIGIVWLHGLGDTEASWTTLLKTTWQFGPSVRWRFLRAPMAGVDVNGGMEMTSWFNMSRMPVVPGCVEYPADIARSVKTVHAAVEDLQTSEDALTADRIFVGGFSQGGAISALAGLSYKHSLGGIINLSGWLLQEETFEKNNETPMLWSHGTADDVVTFQLQKRGVEKLRQRGVRVDDKQYYVGHHTNPDELQFVARWIKSKIPVGVVTPP